MSIGSSLYRDVSSRASVIASDWFVPAMSWFGSWFSESSASIGSHRSDASRIGESLLTELVQQGRILEQKQQQRQQDELAANRVVDYSWLVTVKPKQFDITDAERLDLEQLCQQVSPESYSRVVREFRSALLRDPAPADLTAIMRAIVRRVLDEQHQPNAGDTTPGSLVGDISVWLGQSMINLRSRLGGSTTSMSAAGENLELSSNASSIELGSFDEIAV